MNKYIISVQFLLLFSLNVAAQKINLSGYIIDSETGEYLIGANVYDTLSLQGNISNKFGFYNYRAEKGESICLQASYVGYLPKIICQELISDSSINFYLQPGNSLEEVIVSTTRKEKLEKRAEMSRVEIPLEQIKMLPTLSGEADILKAYQLMPGVQMGSEGNNGIFVRGGTPDQNLFLLDDVPLYNVSHLGGIFSVFDPAMVKSVDLYKGGFPARYGGRISSVIDVRNKDGNLFSSHGEAVFSILMSKLFLEGPLKKEKASYAVSVRRCNLDIYSFLGGKLIGLDDFNGYTFYDVNVKLNYILSERDRLFVNFYQGKDKFYYRDKETVEFTSEAYKYVSKHDSKWGNRTASMRWHHVFGNQIFNNLTLAYSHYEYLNYNYYSMEETGEDVFSMVDEYQFLSQVQDLIVKSDLEIPIKNQKIRSGLVYTKHFFDPGSVSYSQNISMNGEDSAVNAPDPALSLQADELAAYLEFTWHLGEKLSGNFGLRSNQYWVEKRGYTSVEPRVLFNYLLFDNLAIKASWCTMQQNLHLLSNSNTGLPSDLWIPSTATIEPEKSQQVAIGLAHTTQKNYEISVEAYYKILNSLIDYREGVQVYNNSLGWDEKIEMEGTGRVKGLEFLIQKKEGRINGWIGYTLSKNERKFANLNKGESFPFIYDQRHELALVANYKISEKFSLSGTWLYHSGHAITLPTGKYELINTNYSYSYTNDRTIMNDVHIYSSKNGYRMPDYHRLDFGFNFTKPKEKGTAIWTLGIYNAYNRQNAYHLFFKEKNGEIKLYQQSLFPILVNFGYTFKF